MASSRLSSIVALALASTVMTDLLAQKAVAPRRLISIVVQDLADDRPIPATTVRIVDRGGKALVEGLTDADGSFATNVVVAEAFAVQFERIGYLRRPEIMTLPATSANSPLRGRLLRSAGSESYYRQVGSAIERHAIGGIEPGWDLSREMDRASELSAESKAAIESGLSTGARAELSATRKEILAATKTPGNQWAGPYSASPALKDYSGWLGVGTTGHSPDLNSIIQDLANTRGLLKELNFAPTSVINQRTYERLLEEAIRPRAPSDPVTGSQCVSQAGFCPMTKVAPAASPCFCYTPYGPQFGVVK